MVLLGQQKLAAELVLAGLLEEMDLAFPQKQVAITVGMVVHTEAAGEMEDTILTAAFMDPLSVALASALSASFGALVAPIRRTPQTSN